MKSTFLRMLFLSVASAALLRTVCGIHGVSPARLTTNWSNNSDDESFVAIWALSPYGRNAARHTTVDQLGGNGDAGEVGIARIWQDANWEEFCNSVRHKPNDPTRERLLSSGNGIWPSWCPGDDASTGLWDIGSDSVDAPPVAPGLRDRAEPSPDANQSAAPEPPPVRMLAEGPTIPPNIDDGALSTDAQFFQPPDLSSTTDTEDETRLPFNHGGKFWSLRARAR